ncbi:hypothetical protein Tco_0851230 [Tanacetum coccineum]
MNSVLKEWPACDPLALVATEQTLQDPYYQTSKPHKSYAPTSKASLPTRSHATTRYKGKEIAKPITPHLSQLLKKTVILNHKLQKDKGHAEKFASLQEVPNADSGTYAEPLEQDHHNDCRIVLMSVLHLLNLMLILKLDVDENKKIQKQLKKANATLTQELTGCKSILAETSRTLGESNSIQDNCLFALQNKQTEFERLYKLIHFMLTLDAQSTVRESILCCGNELLNGNLRAVLYTISRQETLHQLPNCLLDKHLKTSMVMASKDFSHLNFDYIDCFRKKDVCDWFTKPEVMVKHISIKRRVGVSMLQSFKDHERTPKTYAVSRKGQYADSNYGE